MELIDTYFIYYLGFNESKSKREVLFIIIFFNVCKYYIYLSVTRGQVKHITRLTCHDVKNIVNNMFGCFILQEIAPTKLRALKIVSADVIMQRFKMKNIHTQ
jgi:hypothetical protein